MAAAIRLSRRNEGLTGDNPCVGCILVRDGVVVGRGVTGRVPTVAEAHEIIRAGGQVPTGGRPHAERVALDEAGGDAHGATAYVTLEPCVHHGRTPPCADALVEAGVARVVIGAGDPDPRVAGRGIARLREAGIDVLEGVLRDECRAQLASFLARMERGRPYVILKLAVSPDGFLGRSDRGNVSVTGSVARARVHAMRARCQTVIVGARTAILDRPRLDVRIPGLEHRPVSGVVLDRRGHFKRALREERERTAHLVHAPPTLDGLMELGLKAGWSTILVEGGAAVARSFLEADLVDEIALFVGATPIGGDVASPLLPDHVPRGFELVREERLGPDRLLTMRRT